MVERRIDLHDSRERLLPIRLRDDESFTFNHFKAGVSTQPPELHRLLIAGLHRFGKPQSDYRHIADDLRVQAALGVPYSNEMIDKAIDDLRTQATADAPDADVLAKRYPKAQSRDFDGNRDQITEADALIAYLQQLGTQVDFKLYDDKANVR